LVQRLKKNQFLQLPQQKRLPLKRQQLRVLRRLSFVQLFVSLLFANLQLLVLQLLLSFLRRQLQRPQLQLQLQRPQRRQLLKLPLLKLLQLRIQSQLLVQFLLQQF
jgi:hypothetical protein